MVDDARAVPRPLRMLTTSTPVWTRTPLVASRSTSIPTSTSAGRATPAASVTCQRPKVRSTLSRTACHPGSRRGSWPSRAATSSTSSVSCAAGSPAASRARLSRGRSSARTSAVSCSLPVNSDSSPSRRSACQVPSRPVEQVAPGDRRGLAEAVAQRRPLLAPVGGQGEAGAVGEAVARAVRARRELQAAAVEFGVERASRTCGTGRARPPGRVMTVSSGSPATSMPAPSRGSRSSTTPRGRPWRGGRQRPVRPARRR